MLISPITKETHPIIVKKIQRTIKLIHQQARLSKIKGNKIADFAEKFVPMYETISIISLILFLFNPTRKKQIFSNKNLQAYQQIEEKLYKDLFEANFRFFISSQNSQSINTKIEGIISALSVYTNQPFQKLTIKKNITPFIDANKLNIKRYKERTFSFFNNPVFSVQELTNIYYGGPGCQDRKTSYDRAVHLLSFCNNIGYPKYTSAGVL